MNLSISNTGTDTMGKKLRGKISEANSVTSLYVAS